MTSYCLKCDNDHINLVLRFEWSKMTIWARSRASSQRS